MLGFQNEGEFKEEDDNVDKVVLIIAVE